MQQFTLWQNNKFELINHPWNKASGAGKRSDFLISFSSVKIAEGMSLNKNDSTPKGLTTEVELLGQKCLHPPAPFATLAVSKALDPFHHHTEMYVHKSTRSYFNDHVIIKRGNFQKERRESIMESSRTHRVWKKAGMKERNIKWNKMREWANKIYVHYTNVS